MRGPRYSAYSLTQHRFFRFLFLLIVWILSTMLFFGRSRVFLVDLELVAQMMHPCAVHYERREREGNFTEARSAKEERKHGEFQRCSCFCFNFLNKMRPPHPHELHC